MDSNCHCGLPEIRDLGDLFQHNDRSKSAGAAFPSVRKEMIRCASGADPGHFDMVLLQAAHLELSDTYGPEIEIVFSGHEFPEIVREKISVPFELRTAWPQRWSYCGAQESCFRAEERLHFRDNQGEDVLYLASPSTMDGCNYPVFRIIKDDSLTIRLHDHDSHTGNIGYDCVSYRNLFLPDGIPSFRNKNVATMDLSGIEKMLCTRDGLDQGKIGSNVIGRIPDAGTDIQAFVGSAASSAMS